jgi:hypothetical protein
MTRLKLLIFAFREMSRMGFDMAGAEIAGGELRRQRAMAHKRLYTEAMDAAIALPEKPEPKEERPSAPAQDQP